MNICIAAKDNCQNLEESYGEICVRCNKCGRFCEEQEDQRCVVGCGGEEEKAE